MAQDVDADLVYILWYLLQLVNWFMVFVSATRVRCRVRVLTTTQPVPTVALIAHATRLLIEVRAPHCSSIDRN